MRRGNQWRKRPQGVLKLAEKATHEVTHEFRDWCSQCVQVKAANDPPQTTTEEPEFPIIKTESRHDSEIDSEEGQASHVVSSEVGQSRVWRRKKRKMWKEFSRDRICSAQGMSSSLSLP